MTKKNRGCKYCKHIGDPVERKSIHSGISLSEVPKDYYCNINPKMNEERDFYNGTHFVYRKALCSEKNNGLTCPDFEEAIKRNKVDEFKRLGMSWAADPIYKDTESITEIEWTKSELEPLEWVHDEDEMYLKTEYPLVNFIIKTGIKIHGMAVCGNYYTLSTFSANDEFVYTDTFYDIDEAKDKAEELRIIYRKEYIKEIQDEIKKLQDKLRIAKELAGGKKEKP